MNIKKYFIILWVFFIMISSYSFLSRLVGDFYK